MLVWGSSTLTPVLLQNGLADEVILFVYPVLLGKGKRFFTEGFGALGLELVDSQTGESGVVITRYRPGGEVQTGTY